MEKIRVGIIGCGGIAAYHARLIQGESSHKSMQQGIGNLLRQFRHPRRMLRSFVHRFRQLGQEEKRTKPISGIEGVEIIAAADVSAERLKWFQESFDINNIYTDFRELLARPDIDAILVCTPTYLHCKMTVEAAKHGKHVFCEKPMAINSDECEQMIEACHKAGVVLQIGYVLRFSSERGMIRNVVLRGDIGRPVMWREITNLRAGPSQKWVHDFDLGRGLLWEDSHPLDFLIFTFGDPVSVYAVTGRYKPNETSAPDFIAALIKFASGDQALFTHSYSLPGFGWHEVGLRRNWMQIDVVGPKGFIQFPDENLSNSAVVFRSTPEGKEELARSAVWTSEWGADGYRKELEHFFQCVREGKPSLVSGEEARRVIWLLEGILHSAEINEVCCFENGRPIIRRSNPQC